MVIDSQAVVQIVNRFNADADAGELRHGSELLIDHEHFSCQPDKESLAYGWLTRLQGREDGIYGQVRWTAAGKAATDHGEYRFFSTEYPLSDCKVLSNRKPTVVRPLRLSGLSLTNMPNNPVRPITNRRQAKSESQLRTKGSIRTGLTSGEPTDLARQAADVLLCICRTEKAAMGGRFEDHWNRICNRERRLLRIANRQEGWDKLTDLEPTAHAAYVSGNAGENLYFRKFNEAMCDLTGQFPDLGTEGRWEKLKELYPALFAKFLLDFSRLPPPASV